MIKNSSKQTGDVHVTVIVILLIAILGALGYVFYESFIKESPVTEVSKTKTLSAQDSSKSDAEAPTYTLDDAVTGISKILEEAACEGSGMKTPLATDSFKEVKDSDQFHYQGGMNRINTSFSYAYTQYGCGSQGSVALLKKVGDTWKIVSEDARIYPMCDKVRGQGFPSSIVDKCYVDDRATEPTAL